MTDSGKSPVSIPELSEFLKAGVQFGHESKRWNPKMRDYIFTTKNNIHIIDISKTITELEGTLKALVNYARQGSILFVGTKRQASPIIESEAIRAGAYFINHRWPGGLLTNFPIVMRSLKRLRDLEESFENGVVGITKFEVVKMKDEWTRLDRLYRGIKTMSRFPSAIVIIDPKFEVGAVLESKKLNIPSIALVDTNSDPTVVDHFIPGNDDALKSIELFLKLFADAVLAGNGGEGVKHNLKDYLKAEVQILKREENNSIVEVENASNNEKHVKRIRIRTSNDSSKSTSNEKNEGKKEKNVPKVSIPVTSRTITILTKSKLTLEQAKKMPVEELLKIKGLGEKAIESIKNS